MLATESFFKGGRSPAKKFSRKERKERKVMKGGNEVSEANEVTLQKSSPDGESVTALLMVAPLQPFIIL